MQKYRRQMKTDMLNTEGLEEAIGFDILKVVMHNYIIVIEYITRFVLW